MRRLPVGILCGGLVPRRSMWGAVSRRGRSRSRSWRHLAVFAGVVVVFFFLAATTAVAAAGRPTRVPATAVLLHTRRRTSSSSPSSTRLIRRSTSSTDGGGTWAAAAASVAPRRRLAGPGSSPPTCRARCGPCTPCRAVRVAIQPGVGTQWEYYPEVWRCKCGSKLYMP